MRGYYRILILLGSILLIPHVMALDVTWEITESEVNDGWLVAGGTETAEIVVTVHNTSRTLNSATFSIENELGTFDPVTINISKIKTIFRTNTTRGKGNISVTLYFTDNTYATFTFETPIQIDHNTPYIAFVDYPSEATVNTIANITVRMEDEYKNPIDNRKEADLGGSAEHVKFSCSSSSYFEGNGQEITVPVDQYGNATTELHLPIKAGENVVFVDPQPPRPSNRWVTIFGVGEKIPDKMIVIVDPVSREIVAKSGERFEITMVLMDQYDNPSPNSPISIYTDVEGENTITLWTNQNGIAKLYYGPKNAVGIVTLTADPQLNSLLKEAIRLEFIFGFEKSIKMSANKNVISSKDLSEDSKSEISATLIGGGEVANKPITFTILENEGDSFDVGPYLEDTEGTVSVSSLTVNTNINGKAAVYFYPGLFGETDVKIVNTTIQATYDTLVQNISVQWRNDPYPYANVTVYPDASMCVAPGTNLTVEIKIVADGKVGRFKPVDLVLAICRSERMFEDIQRDFGKQDKMLAAMDVANDFVDNLSAENNQFGLVTFGEKEFSEYEPTKPTGLPGIDETVDDDDTYVKENYPYYDISNSLPGQDLIDPDGGRKYADYATIDEDLGGTIEIEGSIDLITPSSDSSSASINPTRYGVYQALWEIIKSGHAQGDEAIRAVILLVDDRHSTTYGDPVAGGVWNGDRITGEWAKDPIDGNGQTDLSKADYPKWFIFEEISDPFEQNLAVWAVNNDVRIYTVAIPKKGLNNISTDQEEIYRYLTYPTHGNFYIARNYEELKGAFEDIQGELRDIAAENATMELDFVSPVSKDIPVNKTVDEIFNYTFEQGQYLDDPGYKGVLKDESTVVRHWNWTADPAEKEAQDLYGTLSQIYLNKVFNQTGEWNSGLLKFDKDRLGTLKVNHTWVAHIRLQINSTIDESMLFNLFGNNSGLFFGEEGSQVRLPLPNYTVCIMTNMSPTEMNSTLLEIDHLTYGTITTEKVPLTWAVSYSGQDSMLQENIEVMNDYGGWNTVGVQMIKGNETFDTFDWYYSDYPLKTYTVRVTVISTDAGYVRDTCKVTLTTNPPFIRIE